MRDEWTRGRHSFGSADELHNSVQTKVTSDKTGATRLGCALLLKCFQLEGRFPHAKYEIPRSVVDYLAHQLKLDSALFQQYDWEGRTIKVHRAQIREELGFREATAADSDAISAWLVNTHLSRDQHIDHLKAKVLTEFRERKIEPPTPDRIERLIHSACASYEQALFASVMQRLSPVTRTRLDALLDWSMRMEDQDEPADDEPSSKGVPRREVITWTDLKTNPGAVGLECVLSEIDKLRILSQLALPADLFGDVSPAVITLYRQRAATETLYELRRHPDATRYTLLAAFCLQRTAEVTDSLVDLLLLVVHRIGARADKPGCRATRHCAHQERKERIVCTRPDGDRTSDRDAYWGNGATPWPGGAFDARFAWDGVERRT